MPSLKDELFVEREEYYDLVFIENRNQKDEISFKILLELYKKYLILALLVNFEENVICRSIFFYWLLTISKLNSPVRIFN